MNGKKGIDGEMDGWRDSRRRRGSRRVRLLDGTMDRWWVCIRVVSHASLGTWYLSILDRPARRMGIRRHIRRHVRKQTTPKKTADKGHVLCWPMWWQKTAMYGFNKIRTDGSFAVNKWQFVMLKRVISGEDEGKGAKPGLANRSWAGGRSL